MGMPSVSQDMKRHKEIKKAVGALLGNHKMDTVMVLSGQMPQWKGEKLNYQQTVVNEKRGKSINLQKISHEQIEIVRLEALWWYCRGEVNKAVHSLSTDKTSLKCSNDLNTCEREPLTKIELPIIYRLHQLTSSKLTSNPSKQCWKYMNSRRRNLRACC